ncbi:MAG: YwaF family protein [Clostridia bacterium]|nr:YwaF family protein [Clostridia bacterium]
MREFFGFGGYNREPEGFMSWQHLVFVSTLVLIMIALAVYLGIKNRGRSDKEKNRVLIWAALLIDGFELFKIVLCCFRSGNPLDWVCNLPLFLCSIQLITIPLAAFSRGRMKEAALDFVLVFGILGALLGTYGAGNNYGAYPVLSFDNVVSGITHCISGFASLYIAISGMASMKRKNIPLSLGILSVFCILAYLANRLLPAFNLNYMFLMRGDGTPYDLLYNLLSGNAVLYPLSVVLLFFLYIFAFTCIFGAVKAKKAQKKAVLDK